MTNLFQFAVPTPEEEEQALLEQENALRIQDEDLPANPLLIEGNTLNESDIHTAAAHIFADDLSSSDAFAALEEIYDRANREEGDTDTLIGEIGQQLKNTYGVDYVPDFAHLIPDPNGFLNENLESADEVVDWINNWKHRAKSMLSANPEFGREYAIHKFDIDEQIDATATYLKKRISAAEKYGTENGEIKKEGRVGDTVSRFMEGAIADTFTGFGFDTGAEWAEDFFVENPSFDVVVDPATGERSVDILSASARAFGQGLGQIGTGAVVAATVSAMSSGLGAVPAVAGAATKVKSALSVANVFDKIQKSERMAKILQSATSARGIGTAAAAGSGVSQELRDVYSTAYRETGSSELATEAMFLAMPGSTVDFLFDAYIAGKLIHLGSAAKPATKAEKVEKLVKMVEEQTDLEGLAKLRSSLSKLASVQMPRLEGALRSGLVGGVGEAVGEATQGSFAEAALSSVNPQRDPREIFDYTGQGDEALIGFIVGAAMGGAGGLVNADASLLTPEIITELETAQKRISDKEASIQQARFGALTSVDPKKASETIQEAVSADPNLRSKQRAAQQANSAGEAGSIRQQAEANIQGLMATKQALEQQMAGLGFGVAPGERVNIKSQIDSINNQIASQARVVEREDLRERKAKLTEELAKKSQSPESVADKTNSREDLSEELRGVNRKLREFDAKEKAKPESKKETLTNDDIVRNKATQAGANPTADVDTLTREQLDAELEVLNKQPKLSEKLDTRRNEILKKREPLTKEQLHNAVSLDTPVEKLSEKSLSSEENALRQFRYAEGELSPEHTKRLDEITQQRKRLLDFPDVRLDKDVESLSKAELIAEEESLKGQNQALDPVLKDRYRKVQEQRRFNNELSSEEKIKKVVAFDTPVAQVSDNQLSTEFEELSTFPGDLNDQQKERLAAVSSELDTRAEAKLDSQTLGNTAVDDLTLKEADAVIQTLEKNKDALTDKQQARLENTKQRRVELGKTLRADVYRNLSKETKDLVDPNATLGDLIAKRRKLRSQKTKEAIDEAIFEHLDSNNTKERAQTAVEKIDEQLSAAKDPEIVAQLREQRNAALRAERQEAKRSRSRTRANSIRENNRIKGEGVFRADVVGAPIDFTPDMDAQQVEDMNARTGAFVGSPNNIQTYAELSEKQPHYYDLNESTKAPIFDVPPIPSDHEFFSAPEGAELKGPEGAIESYATFSTSAVLNKKVSRTVDVSPAYQAYVAQKMVQHPRLSPKKNIKRKQKPKKISKIMRRLQEIVDVKVRYQKLHPSGSYLGAYLGKISGVITNFANDIDTAVHEIAHAMDHHWGIAHDWLTDVAGPFDQELEQFWIYGTPYQDIEGKRTEGVAEFIRAYIMNPEAARKAAPNFTQYFESKLPPSIVKEFEGITYDIEDLVNSDSANLMGNHIQSLQEAMDLKFGWLGKLFGQFHNYGTTITKLQQLQQHLGVDTITDVLFKNGIKEMGIEEGTVLPISDFRVFTRGIRKFAGRFLDVIERGIPDPNLDNIDQKTGMQRRLTEGGLGKIFSMFNNPNTIESDLHDGLSLLVAERTIEKAKPLLKRRNELMKLPDSPEKSAELRQIEKGLRQITGVTGQILIPDFHDYSVAKKAIEEFKQDPDRYNQLKEFGRLYQDWSKGVLQYMVGKGMLSKQQYQRIVNANEHYVTMFRLHELEPEVFAETEGNFLAAMKGSTKSIKNPLVSLFKSTHKAMQQADQNEMKLKLVDFHDVVTFQENVAEEQLKSDLKKQGKSLKEIRSEVVNLRRQQRRDRLNSGMFGGEPTRLSNVMNKLEMKPEGPAPNVITVKRNGKPEYWSINDTFVADQFKNLTSTESTSIPVLGRSMRMFQSFVTRTPPFAIKNLIRDTDHRLFVSDSTLAKSIAETAKAGGKFAKNVVTNPKETLFARTESMELSLLRQYGGDQSGYYVRHEVDFARGLRALLRDAGLTKESVFVSSPKKIFDLYNKTIESSEQANRLIEYKAAYQRAVDQGYDPLNAHIYAGNSSAGMMDFTSAGDWFRFLNNFVPFASAGSVAVRTTVSAAKRHGAARSAMRMALTGGLPVLIERAMAQAGGYEDEWDQAQGYIKDYFYSFKYAPDQWIRVPKSYETGIISGAFRRALDYSDGKLGAWDDFGSNLWHAYIPFDPFDLGNPILGITQVPANYDAFRQKPIVPVFENTKRLSLRKFPEGSSLVAQGIHNALISMGVDDTWAAMNLGDARKIDAMAQMITGTAGDLVLSLPDLASADARGRYLKKLGGVFSSTPAYMARDPKFVVDFAAKQGLSLQSKHFDKYLALQNAYFDARTSKEKDRAADAFLAEALRLRKIMEEKGDAPFLSAKTVATRKAMERERNK